ncbi:MAG: hypothetical protein ILA34_04845 [Bacteroidaceae bacterium]|nr:hypothetical protein [Bacteroidaceae bacterium]
MKEKYLIYGAKLLSIIFAPFYFSMLAFIVMFVFSYMKLLPMNYKLLVLGIVYAFTVAIPLLSIASYRKLSGLRRHQMTRRELRFVPYVITIVSYACCLFLMQNMHIPHFMISVLCGALAVEVVCALLNNWIRVSTHAAAAGAMNGALLAFSLLFHFNPLGWLCITIFIAGLVGTSRLILRQHTLGEVGWGTLIGFVCGFVCIFFV